MLCTGARISGLLKKMVAHYPAYEHGVATAPGLALDTSSLCCKHHQLDAYVYSQIGPPFGHCVGQVLAPASLQTGHCREQH
jgi:hypothetical protein